MESRAPRRYRSSLRDAQARRTRQRVLDAATAVFLDRGYGAATIRAIAAEAKVSVPTVEALFGTKARLLKAAIDVAIAGDDEPVAVLDRSWAADARRAGTTEEFLSVVASAVGAAQARSAGLVLAVFEGSARDRELEQVAEQMVAQRAVTASWIVEGVSRVASLREGCGKEEAIDTVWLLMDPVVFDRLTRRRNWTLEHYEHWFSRSVARLLTADAAATVH
jgi:AcrR family transcriptional regulator